MRYSFVGFGGLAVTTVAGGCLPWGTVSTRSPAESTGSDTGAIPDIDDTAHEVDSADDNGCEDTEVSTVELDPQMLDYWEYSDWRDDETMVGVDGWDGGYSADLWYGSLPDSGNGYVYSTTDDNVGDAPGDWGEGGALDNWFVNRGVDIQDGAVRGYFYTEDADTVGLVFAFESGEDYYLLLMTGEGGSSPTGSGAHKTQLVRIEDGMARVLDEADESHSVESLQRFQIASNDGLIVASFYSDADYEDDDWSTADFTLTAIDESPHEAGAAGYYAYDAGGSATDATHSYFGNISVLRFDEDGDDIADDEDNCEDIYNPDQIDRDADGLGSNCDADDCDDEVGEDTTAGPGPERWAGEYRGEFTLTIKRRFALVQQDYCEGAVTMDAASGSIDGLLLCAFEEGGFADTHGLTLDSSGTITGNVDGTGSATGDLSMDLGDGIATTWTGVFDPFLGTYLRFDCHFSYSGEEFDCEGEIHAAAE